MLFLRAQIITKSNVVFPLNIWSFNLCHNRPQLNLSPFEKETSIVALRHNDYCCCCWQSNQLLPLFVVKWAANSRKGMFKMCIRHQLLQTRCFISVSLIPFNISMSSSDSLYHCSLLNISNGDLALTRCFPNLVTKLRWELKRILLMASLSKVIIYQLNAKSDLKDLN